MSSDKSKLQATTAERTKITARRPQLDIKWASGDNQLVSRGADNLSFEPIPHAMRHKCVRAVLPVDVWRLLRKMTIDVSGNRYAQCGTSKQLECHEIWDYPSIPGADGLVRQVMKLVRLQALCHLCHVVKHIGFARSDARQYRQVKYHLRAVYGVSDEEFAVHEQQAVERVAELNRAGPRSLDLTFLNADRFMWIQHRFGRRFTEDETGSCRNLDNPTDVEG